MSDQQWFEENIDPPVASLVIKMNMIVRTTWSCGGHVANNLLYHYGFKLITDSDQFLEELDALLKNRFRFASLYPLPGSFNGHTVHYLQVDSFSLPEEWKEDTKKVKKYYDKTYGRLHAAMEELVDNFLKENP